MAPEATPTCSNTIPAALSTPPSPRPSEVRATLLQRARDQGALINPRTQPPGLGNFLFLQPSDQQSAHELGYTSYSDIIAARATDALSHSTGPTMLWIPEARYRNPDTQPEGEGSWMFLSGGEEGDEELAALNFGGGQYGLPARPSAAQIWRLRTLLRADPRREDATAEIDLVWVPSASLPVASSEEEGEEAIPVLPPLSLSTAASPFRPARSSPTASPSSALPEALTHFDPTNAGTHSQLGNASALYDIRLVQGHWITVDRSRLVPGVPEEHKLWVFGSSGWSQYKHAGGLEWNEPKSVEKANKYRDQAYERAGWPALRDKSRRDYSREQREYILGLLGEKEGRKLGIREVVRGFEEMWPGEGRSEAALSSLVDRLKGAKGGVLRERKGRGWWQKERGERMRRENNVKGGESDDGSEGKDDDDGEGKGVEGGGK